jgi:hypothetical protein
MLVRIMESQPARLRTLAREWGVYREGLSLADMTARIEAAYRREVEAEARREAHRRLIAQMRAPA